MGFVDPKDIADTSAPTSGRFVDPADVVLARGGKRALPAEVPTAEQEALQPVAEDPVYEVKRAFQKTAVEHPYLTGAAVGAVLGPTAGAETAGALGGPALTAAAGAAEQTAYTGIADVASKVAGPEHPYIGAAVGLATPFIAPRLARGALGIGAAKSAAKEAETAAQEEVQTTAAKAADKQEAANLSEHVTAADKVAKEAQANKKVIAKAASVQGSKNLAELADAHDAAAQKIGEFGQKLKERSDAVASGGEKSAQARQAALAEVAPQEAERQRRQLLGKSPAETQAAQALPPAEAAARRTAVRQAVFGPIERRSDEMGAQFEKHYSIYRDKEADPATVVSAAKDEMQYAEKAGAFTPSITKLMTQATGMGGASLDLESVISPQDLKRMSEVTKTNLRNSLAKGKSITWQGSKGEWNVIDPNDYHPKPTTVQDMLKLRRAASTAIRTEKDWPSKSAAWRIVSAVDKTLEESGVPKPTGLNQEWKDYRDLFDHNFNRRASTTIEPADLGTHLFEEPQRALNLFRYATPEESQTLRDNFADWVNTKGYSLADIGSKVNPAVRRAVFGDGALAGKEPWFQMEPKAIELKTLINSSSVARSQYGAAYGLKMQQIEHEMAEQTRKEAYALAKDLGPAGKPISAALFRARTPQEINAAAKQLAQMTPGDVVKGVASAQVKPGQAAYEASLTAKRSARQAFDKLSQTQTQPGQAAQQAVASLPLASDAARSAIVDAKPGAMESRLKRFLAFRTLWYAGSIIGGSIMGHTPMYAVGMAALDGAMSTFLGTRAMGRAMLRNPAVAEKVWQAVKEPKGLDGLQKAGRATAEMQALLAMQRAQQQSKPQEEAPE